MSKLDDKFESLPKALQDAIYNQGNPMSKPKQKSRPKKKDNRKRK